MARPKNIRRGDGNIEKFEEGVERLEEAYKRLDQKVERLEESTGRLEEEVEPLEERAGEVRQVEDIQVEPAGEAGAAESETGAVDDCLCESCKITLQLKDAHLQGVSAADCPDGIIDSDGNLDTKSLVMSDEKRVLGLFGMIERIELAGCSLRFDFRPDEGTTIHLEVPIESEEGTL